MFPQDLSFCRDGKHTAATKLKIMRERERDRDIMGQRQPESPIERQTDNQRVHSHFLRICQIVFVPIINPFQKPKGISWYKFSSVTFVRTKLAATNKIIFLKFVDLLKSFMLLVCVCRASWQLSFDKMILRYHFNPLTCHPHIIQIENLVMTCRLSKRLLPW